MRRLGIWTGLAIWAAWAAPTQAGDLVFEWPVASNDASAEIIGGTKQDPALWPATLVFTSATGERCTATAIGPRVLLTAGHCVRSVASGAIRGAGTKIACEPHENYSSGVFYDMALCLASADIGLPGGAPYERIDIGLPAAAREQLMLLGYGCTSLGGTSGVLYGGGGQVRTPATAEAPYFVTSGGAALCSGDSGGGAYRVLGAVSRQIVGVASAMEGGGAASNFVSLADSEIAGFIRSWRERATDAASGKPIKAEICGIDPIYSCHP